MKKCSLFIKRIWKKLINMIFTTFDVGFWYDCVFAKNLSIDKYNRYLDFIENIGFDYIYVDEHLIPFVAKCFDNRNIQMILSPSFVKGVEKKDDDSFDLEFFRNDYERLTNKIYQDVLKSIDSILGVFSDNVSTSTIESIPITIHLGSYLECTLYIEHMQEILEGLALEYHDKNIKLFEDIFDKFVDLNFAKYIYHSQIIGFGAENKERYDLNPLAIANCVNQKIYFTNNFYYFTPTQSSHDSKYLLTNILNQKHLKDIYGISSGWGAMGIYGFPTTSTTAYLNGIDMIHMVTNEKTYGKNRLTFVGFDDVEKLRISLIKESISAIRQNDRDKILFMNRKYSQECTKNSITKNNIYDEHFSLDWIR